MIKKEVCGSCGDKPAEYALDERHLCVECYVSEENKIRSEEVCLVEK